MAGFSSVYYLIELNPTPKFSGFSALLCRRRLPSQLKTKYRQLNSFKYQFSEHGF